MTDVVKHFPVVQKKDLDHVVGIICGYAQLCHSSLRASTVEHPWIAPY